MKTINKYFLDKTDKVSFIELKKGARVDVGDYTIEDDLPLPIVTDTLLKEVNDGAIENEFKASHLIEGIIYILGIDRDFKYKDEYIEILYSYDSNIEDYILYRGFKYIQSNDYEIGTLFFRALTHINKENIQGLFNYALCLENLSKDFINRGEVKKANDFILESTNCLENLLDISEEFAPAYYKLGYYYRYFNQFLKAKLTWEKYMKLRDNEEHLQEVREQLDLLTDDVNFEEGLNYLNRGEYEAALERFLELTQKHRTWWNVFYLSGLAYKGLGDYENAIGFFYEAINLNGKDVNLYNELGICLFSLGDIDEAINIFNKGIKLDDNDYKIVFNRGMAYMKLGLKEKAIEDINAAYMLNPNDDTVRNQVRQLDVLNLDIQNNS
ncbi:MAG: tetratricopeptide repeat protein [Tissierellia bacterium]|nr:tetratricopeptide repeat protein [Tissierellia bacterium]